MNTKTNQDKPTSVMVLWNGKRVPATCDAKGVVRVYDEFCGHFSVCHNLTEAQRRYVRSRVRPT